MNIRTYRPYIIAIVALILLSPSLVFAAMSDPRCFTEPECIEARTSFLSKEEAKVNPLYQGTDTKKVCGVKQNGAGEKVGFCYPSTKAITSIKIGGKQSFDNIGEYIKSTYTFAIGVAGIIAVIVIIVSGIQITASAGNANIVSQAKTRIVNAIVGLLIAVGSFVILNTLNPYLVNLRLPRSWLIKPQIISANLCENLEEGSKIAELGLASEKKNELQIKEAIEKAKKGNKFETVSKAHPECIKQYVIEGTQNICMGSICPKKKGKNQVCVDHTCVEGRITGEIINSSYQLFPNFATENWGSDMVDGTETEIWAICKNGKHFEVEDVTVFHKEVGSNKANYLIKASDASIAASVQSCNDNGNLGVAGYMLKLEMDEANDPKDENHWVGKAPNGDVVDLGDDAAKDKTISVIVKDSSKIKNYLISPLEMSKGFVFNIDVARISDIDTFNPLGGVFGDGLSGDDLRQKVYYDKFGTK